MSDKMKNIKSKFIEYMKFNIIGISNFIVSQLFYITLYIIFKLHYIIAYTITSILSITAAYFLNSKYTFKEKKYCPKKFYMTGLVYIFEYALNLGIIVAMVNYLHIGKIIAPFIAPVISTPITFFLMRLVIKKKE